MIEEEHPMTGETVHEALAANEAADEATIIETAPAHLCATPSMAVNLHGAPEETEMDARQLGLTVPALIAANEREAPGLIRLVQADP
jgi:hypothetical protein